MANSLELLVGPRLKLRTVAGVSILGSIHTCIHLYYGLYSIKYVRNNNA